MKRGEKEQTKERDQEQEEERSEKRRRISKGWGPENLSSKRGKWAREGLGMP